MATSSSYDSVQILSNNFFFPLQETIHSENLQDLVSVSTLDEDKQVTEEWFRPLSGIAVYLLKSLNLSSAACNAK